MAQVVGAPFPGAPQGQPPGPPPGQGPLHRSQPQAANPRPRQPPAGQQQHRHSSQHARRPGGSAAAGSRRPPGGAPGGSSSRHGAAKGGGQPPGAAAQPTVVVPTIAADNMADLEQLRRVTPFICNIRFRNNLPEIPSDPKLIMALYEPERLSKFFLTSVEQQPQRELLLPADVGVPISALDMERYDVPDDLDPRPKLDPQDEALLQDVEGLPTGGAGGSTSIREVKRSTKGVVSWLMNTTYLTSGGDAGPRKGTSAGRFQMGSSSQQAEELTREQQLADIEATFAAARNVPRHPTKPGVTAVRSVPILPDVEAWPNKYVVVQFPEGDPATDSRTLAKVRAPDMRRELLSRSMLKSYQTPGSHSGRDLTVGLLVPHDQAATAISGGQLPDELSPEEMAGDYSWDCEYNFDLHQHEVGQPPQQLLLMMHDDKVGYCNLDGTLKLRKRKRQPTDGPRPQKAVVEHRGYHDNEVAERQDRLAQIEVDPSALALEGEPDIDGAAGAAAEDVFGPDEDDEGYQEDAEGAEQGGLGYQ